MGVVGAGPALAGFDIGPWWIIALKAVVILAFLLLGTVIVIWAERRLRPTWSR